MVYDTADGDGPSQADRPDGGETAGRGLPLHYGMSLLLRERIVSAEYAPGSMLPGEEHLARQAGVSRVTARRALATLEAEGLIHRVRGRGTFVRAAPVQEQTRASLHDALRDMRQVAGRTAVTVLEFERRTAPAEACERLARPAGSEMLWAVRLRSLGPRQLMHLASWIPLEIAGGWQRSDLEKRSLQCLLRSAGAVVAEIQQTVTAGLAEPTVAARLRVRVGSPLLQVRRRYHGADGNAFALLDVLGPAAAFELRMTLQADEAQDHR